MRLFIAIFFLLSAPVSFAAGITSKTADFVIYKNSLGGSTIPISNWELIIDGDSLAGKSSLPVPKSNKTFDTKLPMPRGKLLSNLAKLARLNPYLFVAQGLIDLYFDERTKQFMRESSSDPFGAADEFNSILQQGKPGAILTFVGSAFFDRKDRAVIGWTYPNGRSGYSGVSIRRLSDGKYEVVGLDKPVEYSTSDGLFNSFRGLDLSSLPRMAGSGYAIVYQAGQTQLQPATDSDIVKNLDKNLTADKLPLVRDLVKSQNWTLETDTTPTVTGPSEVVISTSTRTRQNPDGTTTTEKVVEKNVYTYNNNVITENYVIQVFYGDQLVENNVTNVNTETGTEPVDYTFQPPSGEYPTDMKIPEKRDLVAEVLNPVASQLQGFGSKIGLRGSGQCSFDVPFSLGLASGSGRLDFCQYQSTFSTLGSMLVAFAYLMAGLIVLGMRH